MIEDRKTHLTLIQAVITRLAGNGFLIKGWSVTLTSALLGLAAKELQWKLAAVALLPVLLFYGLDGYFLMLERQFRALYDRARAAPDANFSANPFALGVDAYPPANTASPSKAITWSSCLRRPAVAGLHLPMLVVVVLAALYVGFVKDDTEDKTTAAAFSNSVHTARLGLDVGALPARVAMTWITADE